MKLQGFKRSFFDIMVWGYLFIATISFILVTIFTNYNIEQILINERTETLRSQARLIIANYVKDYFEGDMNNVQLSNQLSTLQTLLGSEIWICNADGQFIAISSNRGILTNDQEYHVADDAALPPMLNHISPNIDRSKSFSKTGNFYKFEPEQTLSIGIPITKNHYYIGYIIIHRSLSDIADMKLRLLKFLWLSYLLIILLCLLFLYHFSRKILIPLEQINQTAADYSNGNFDSTLVVDDHNEIGELANSLNDMASELQKMEDYRKNFIANVSHDFRSPLTSIKGYLEAIQDGTIPPEKQSHYIDVVLNETKRLTKLTSGLLTLNDFNSSNALILKKKIFNINDMILNTIDSFEGSASRMKILILPDIPNIPLMVYADKDKIYQVIYNLLDNAIKFSHPNSSIFVTALETENDKVTISVKDNGEGISEEHQKHIWERFYKVDSSRGRDKSGTGLGLSIVKEIIKAHDETISMESKEGKGTQFTFTLPKAVSH